MHCQSFCQLKLNPLSALGRFTCQDNFSPRNRSFTGKLCSCCRGKFWPWHVVLPIVRGAAFYCFTFGAGWPGATGFGCWHELRTFSRAICSHFSGQEEWLSPMHGAERKNPPMCCRWVWWWHACACSSKLGVEPQKCWESVVKIHCCRLISWLIMVGCPMHRKYFWLVLLHRVPYLWNRSQLKSLRPDMNIN